MKYSNCLIEALKHKLVNPKSVTIYKRGKWSELLKFKFPHFYWHDKSKNCYLHFCRENKKLLFVKQLWFRGRIRKFDFHV